MVIIYNFILAAYKFLISIASAFNPKAKKWLKGRKNVYKVLEEKLKDFKDSDGNVWFHAASLGEFEQGRPIIEKYKKAFPNDTIILTFFSPSGYEVQKKYQVADIVIYMPLDTKKNVSRFLQLVNPKTAIFIKYEFWYNYLTQMKKMGVKIILASAIFRREQVFFKPYGEFFRNMLNCFEHIFVQDVGSVSLLESIGFSQVSITGDTRFDRVVEIAENPNHIEIAENFIGDKFTFVFGSTWEKDEDILVEYINQSGSEVKYIIAPHEITSSHIKSLQKKLDRSSVLYSSFELDNDNDKQVLIIDNIGMLSSLYAYGQIAYVGGGFGDGIHNILEAAVYGMPVVFGPNFGKFREARDLVEEEGAFVITDFNELKDKLDNLLTKKRDLEAASRICRDYVELHTGATDVIINYLKNS